MKIRCRRRWSLTAVFGFLQVCTRMTFRFNRLNSTSFISSLKNGMKKLEFWARKRRIGVLGPEKDILEYLENSHHTWTYVNSQKISQKGHLRSITISRSFGVTVTLVIYGLAHLTLPELTWQVWMSLFVTFSGTLFLINSPYLTYSEVRVILLRSRDIISQSYGGIFFYYFSLLVDVLNLKK